MRSSSNIIQKRASFFRNVSVHDPISKSVRELLESFRDDTYKQVISDLRKCLPDEYKIKKSQLPAITFCGEFKGGHKKENLFSYNEIMILDIDKASKEELLRIKSIFTTNKYVLSFWESPSQNGLKALIVLHYQNPTENVHDNHKEAFRIVAEYLETNFNIILDNCGSDISRLCFVSHDENLIIKDKIEYFEVLITEPRQKTKQASARRTTANKNRPSKNEIIVFDKRHRNPINKNKQNERLEISRIIKYLKSRKLSITESYEDWYRVGFAIANSFDCELGKKYYLELCRLDGVRHDEEGSLKMLCYCYDVSQGDINFATIIFLAQKKGFHKHGKGGEDGANKVS